MATYSKVKLLDGRPAQVRHLLLFELDDVPRNVPDDYTYTVKLLTGETFEAYFNFKEPRVKPAGSPEEAKDGTPEYYAWREWLRQEEGKKHQLAKYDAYADYCHRVGAYIRRHCIEGEVADRIATADDWRLIYNAAFGGIVTQEDIARAMRDNFRG